MLLTNNLPFQRKLSQEETVVLEVVERRMVRCKVAAESQFCELVKWKVVSMLLINNLPFQRKLSQEETVVLEVVECRIVNTRKAVESQF